MALLMLLDHRMDLCLALQLSYQTVKHLMLDDRMRSAMSDQTHQALLRLLHQTVQPLLALQIQADYLMAGKLSPSTQLHQTDLKD
jgi:hypothetical protein